MVVVVWASVTHAMNSPVPPLRICTPDAGITTGTSGTGGDGGGELGGGTGGGPGDGGIDGGKLGGGVCGGGAVGGSCGGDEGGEGHASLVQTGKLLYPQPSPPQCASHMAKPRSKHAMYTWE